MDVEGGWPKSVLCSRVGIAHLPAIINKYLDMTNEAYSLDPFADFFNVRKPCFLQPPLGKRLQREILRQDPHGRQLRADEDFDPEQWRRSANTVVAERPRVMEESIVDHLFRI
jgi:hypothetical protein